MAEDLVDALVAAATTGGAPVLRLFGEPAVCRGGRRFEVPEGSKRLLVFLALHRGHVDRTHAAGVLWPSGSDERAAGNFRSALWRLNQAHLDLIQVDRHRVSFRRDVLVDVDVVASWAKRLIDGRSAGEDLAVLPGGAESFDLLPGWYDDWVLLERERLRQRVLHALEAMSRHLVTLGRCAEAVEAALVATGAEPLRESAQRTLLEAHLAEGNWVEAQRALDAFRDVLGRELGLVPDPLLTALLDAYPRAVRPREDWSGAVDRGSTIHLLVDRAAPHRARVPAHRIRQ